ncbi:N-acetylmuramoyl-L-alanine amidase [Halomonas sp. BM-2019]|uniref:N-acetylmuramoyl-L-alanine amidase n=1 Tax=Halomonas sp. BM-2019 TaxID=2811227 RepID=UPI001B3C21FD|nr:MAG: LysM peptidoglycan-binding domain-containing protein [Halomonas sp. BM-2019]
MSVVPKSWMPKAAMKRIVCHWTAGTYKASDLDRKRYHILIESDGNLVQGIHSIADNVSTSDHQYAAHTHLLNTGSIGISVCCMAEARERPFDAGRRPRSSPRPEPRRLVVKRGDTLFALAARHLGNGSRWSELLQAAGTPFDEASARGLAPGDVLLIPARPGSDSPDVQITGRANYAFWSHRLGLDLVADPDLTFQDPSIAARILVQGMRDGTFRAPHKLARHVNEERTDFYNAREVINADKARVDRGHTQDRGTRIARIAERYLSGME